MYRGAKVIDVHGHMTTPAEVSRYLNGLLMQRLPSPGPFHTIRMSDDSLEEAQQGHLKRLDEYNIDFQLISPRPASMMHWETDYVQERWCMTTNDIIKRIVDLHPDRFAGVGQLPQNVKKDTRNCLAEFERCVAMGFVGMIVNPDPGAMGEYPGMHHEWWYPLYEIAQKYNAPLMIHPSITRDPRVESVMNNYQVNNMTEEFLATITLEHSKVFKLFPRLKIVVCHFGGAFNRFLMTDDYHYFGNKPLDDNLTFDCCAHDVGFITLGIQQKGVARILFGTEAPGAGSHAKRPPADPVAPGRPADDLVPVIGGLRFLSEDDKIAIFNGNPLRIYAKIKAGIIGTAGKRHRVPFEDVGYPVHGDISGLTPYEPVEGLRI